MKQMDISKLSSKELTQLRNQVDQTLTIKIKESRNMALNQIKELVQENEIDPETVTRFLVRRSSKASKSAPRYKDPETGKTWTGKGRTPNWMVGRDKEAFAL